MTVGILLDADTGDLLVKQGGIVIGDNSGQIIEQVIVANRGEFREHPLLGAELTYLANGNYNPFWANDTKDMLKIAGVKVSRVCIKENQITVE